MRAKQKNNIHSWVLISLFALAFVARVAWISRPDPLTDEVLYAFRAVGMLDFDEGDVQQTPLEWLDSKANPQSDGIPWWTHTSFHDHPPLVFLAQHISMSLFGETVFAFRLPSALFGMGTLWLLWRIATLLYGYEIGIVALFLGAVSANALYISRIGLQESQVIFFILLSVYFALRARDRERYRIWTGVALGLGFLTKYTALISVPIVCSIWIASSGFIWLRKKETWIGVVVALLLASPVLVYNYELYRAFGHFDFQLSYIVGQHPDAWKVAPGKEIGTLADRIRRFPSNFLHTNSWAFVLSSIAALICIIIGFIKRGRVAMREQIVLVSSLIFLLLLIVKIGPSYRFLTMLTPFLILAQSVFFVRFLGSRKKVLLGVLVVMGAFELGYAWNSVVAWYPHGRAPWAYAEGLHDDLASWGYNDLDTYFKAEFAGLMPESTFDMRYQFLEDIHASAVERDVREKLKPTSAVVIYDGNVQNLAQLWILDRWNIYHAWPVLKTEQFFDYLRANSSQDSFKTHYFIVPTDKVPLRHADHQTIFGAQLESQLRSRGMKPTRLLTNQRGEETFRIYKF